MNDQKRIESTTRRMILRQSVESTIFYAEQIERETKHYKDTMILALARQLLAELDVRAEALSNAPDPAP